MIESMLRRNVVFVAGWIVAGLAIAFVVNHLRDEGTARSQRPASAAPAATSGLAPPKVVAAHVSDVHADAATQAAPVPATSAAVRAPVLSYAPAVRVSAPAVVSLYTLNKVRVIERSPLGLGSRQRDALREGLGSGVIVDAQGHIVTNEHVVKSAARIDVMLADGRSATASVIGTDPGTDLAVLKIDMQPLPIMTLGRSDRLEVGDVVLAIGNPFGLSQTVTQGIVSATGRADLKLSRYESYIQTDAAINKGNSGGALVNTRGELVGINTAVLGDETAEGLGVAIPVDLLRGVMQEILQHGRVARGWLGIKLADVSEEYARNEGIPRSGVVIWELHPESPALQAGLGKNDLIETIDGQPARTGKQTLALVANHKPGTTVKFTGVRARNAEPFSVDLKVIEPPPGSQRD